MRPGDGPAAALVGPSRGVPCAAAVRDACTEPYRQWGSRSLGTHPRENEWGRVSREGRGAPAAGAGGRGVSGYSGRLRLMTRGYAKGRGREHSPRCREPLHPALEETRGPPMASGSGSAAGARRAERSLGSKGEGGPSPALGYRRPTDRPMRRTTRLHTENLIFFFFFEENSDRPSICHRIPLVFLGDKIITSFAPIYWVGYSVFFLMN